MLGCQAATLLGAVGVRVGLCAAASWPIFGLFLLALARRLPRAGRPSPLNWADLCLRTMAWGMIGLAAAAAFNLIGRYWPPSASTVRAMNATCLVASNLTMAAHFARGARGFGLSSAAVWAAWLLGLNGTFALLYLLLSR